MVVFSEPQRPMACWSLHSTALSQTPAEDAEPVASEQIGKWGARLARSTGRNFFVVSQSDIERVTSIRVLGVVINDQLTATDHVSYILSACTIYCMHFAFFAVTAFQISPWRMCFRLLY